jgi:DNA-binding IclR family transcriptional regulator
MLERAVTILDSFRPTGGPFRLAELVRRSGLPKSTVHRLVGDLVRLGLVEQAGAGYRLGPKLFELGALAPRQRDLREAALPFMQDLFEATRETVHLGIRDGHQVVYVEKMHGRDPLELPSRIGGGLPLTCTAVGKALLAFSGEQVLTEVLSGPLPAITPRSITDPARLRTAIELVQATAIAAEEQEAAVGVSCIAAPVLDGGRALAALSVAVPSDRFRPAALAAAVRTAALGLSRALHATG